MRRKALLLAGILSCVWPTTSPAETVQQAAALFGVRESVEHIDLSPDGSHVIYVAGGRGAESSLHIAKLGGQAVQITQASGNPDRLSWCNFASDDRLVCRVDTIADYVGTPIGASRLLSLGADGKDAKLLGQRESFYDTRLRQFDGHILDWLPSDGNAVLMARDYVPEAKAMTRLMRREDGLGVDRIDLRTLKASVVERADKDASGFITDGRGNVRIRESRSTRSAGEQLGARTDYHYRRANSSKWEKLGSYDGGTRQGMIPVAVDADLDTAYVLKKLEGRFALYRVKLDGTMATELAYANPKVDVDDVVRVGRGQKVIGVTFAEEQRQTIYFDPEYKKLAGTLSRSIPLLPLVRFVGASNDGSKLLIFAGSDSDPGRYYVYDRKKPSLEEIVLVRPELERVKLATVRPVSYPAPDGVSVPGYLTLPPGSDGKNLPAVILPHGGPSARDEWGFDWLAQFLANQGYAVLQPNYRGSDGFGDAWMQQNGFRSWQTSIGDISAGAKWLIGQGVANPTKLAILGWSYGGYAALQSAVVEPSLYKAVVAIAPVTDLNMVKEEASQFTNAALISEFVGSGPHTIQGSPLQNVAKISAPVLMFHGDKDLNVGVAQSRAMDQALKAARKRSELIVYPGLEHSLMDSKVRIQMLEKIAGFLTAATR